MNPGLVVLLIEDSEQDAALVLRELRRGGLDVHAERVETAAAVTQAMERGRWDAVLADFDLPGFNAFAALTLVRAVDEEVPFIVVSGTVGEATAVEVMRAGAHDYVMKDHLARLVPALLRELREAEGRRARARTARRLATQHAVAALLARARPVRETLGHVLGVLASSLGWHFASYWEPRDGEEILEARLTWCELQADLQELEVRTRATSLRAGAALPGLVFATGDPEWVPDADARSDRNRHDELQRAGVRAGLAFPVGIEGATFGVIELLSRREEARDPELIETLRTIGAQLGQAIARERAVAALHRSEALKSSMLDASLDAIVAMDHRGRIVDFNPAAARLFGVPRDTALGEELASLIVPPRLRDAHRAGLARYLATGEGKLIGRRVELPALGQGGAEFPAEVAILRLDSDPERPVFTAFVRDLSERKAAEQGRQLLADATAALSASFNLAETLTAVAQLCAKLGPGWCTLDVFDDAGTLRRLALAHADPSKQAKLEALAPESLVVPLRVITAGEALLAPEPTASSDAGFGELLAELGTERVLGVPICAEGSQVRGVLTIAAPHVGSRPGVLDPEVASELARRVGLAMENADLFSATQRAEARQRLLAHVSTALVESLDARAALQRASELLVPELADWCEAVLVSRQGTPERVAFARARGAAALAASLTSAPLLGDEAGLNRALRAAEIVVGAHAPVSPWVARDGPEGSPLSERLPESFVILPLTSHGVVLGALSLARARGGRTFEQQDVPFVQEIALRCASAVENARLYEEVQESLRARDEFLALAAHELQMPLTPLWIQTQAVLRHVDRATTSGLDVQRLRDGLGVIARAATRLVELVQRLLEASRMTVGHVELELEELDLVTLAKETVASLSLELRRAGCEVAWEVPGAVVVGRWDRPRLVTVMKSLLSNAMKFGAGRAIEVSIADEGRSVRLSIRDHGPGISSADQARIFERFSRPAPVRHFGGFGLGLWVVQRIVEEHQGSVSLEAPPGGGASFSVRLPREAPGAKMKE